MKTCVFFGHRDIYQPNCRQKIIEVLEDLIKNEGFTQFYSGGRGIFDRVCAEAVGELRKSFPKIKNTLVFSYLPPSKEHFTLPSVYTDTMYILDKRVPPLYAVIETNKCMVDKADCLVVGIKYNWGGAWQAVEYAQRKGKRIINIFQNS